MSWYYYYLHFVMSNRHFWGIKRVEEESNKFPGSCCLEFDNFFKAHSFQNVFLRMLWWLIQPNSSKSYRYAVASSSRSPHNRPTLPRRHISCCRGESASSRRFNHRHHLYTRSPPLAGWLDLGLRGRLRPSEDQNRTERFPRKIHLLFDCLFI